MARTPLFSIICLPSPGAAHYSPKTLGQSSPEIKIRGALKRWKKLVTRVKVLWDQVREKEPGPDYDSGMRNGLSLDPIYSRHEGHCEISKDTIVQDASNWLRTKYNMDTPKTTWGWSRWLHTHEYHRARLADLICPRTMNEAESMKNRKVFYKNIMKLSQSTRVTALLVDGKIVTDPQGLEKATVAKVEKLVACEEYSKVPLRKALQNLTKMSAAATTVVARLRARHLDDGQRSKIIENNKPLKELKKWFKANHSVATPGSFTGWVEWLSTDVDLIKRELISELGPDPGAEPLEMREEDHEIKEALSDMILMSDPTLSEIREAVTDMNGQSQAGELPPSILKVAALYGWDRQQERDRDPKANGPQPKPEKEKPREVLLLLQRIIKMAIKGKDLPSREKMTVTTNIPKKEGQVNDQYR